MCLNNYVDSAVKKNWSAFMQSTVEIKIPWQMVYLVQGNNLKYENVLLHSENVCVQITTRSLILESLMTTSSL